MTTLTIRLRLPTGQSTITIAAEAPLSTLLAQVADVACSPAEALVLSSGFPPQPLRLEGDVPVSSVLHNMDTVTVANTAPVAPPTIAAKGGRGRGRGRAAGGAARGGGRSSPAPGGGVHTLSDVSGGSAASSSRKRPAAGDGGGKTARTVGAMQLGSEEGIGASLLGAVGSKKGAAALHSEDPAASFLKAASQSALAHHVEEVHANERFGATLGTSCEYIESEVGRRLDGEATQCDVRFKVGRATRGERFALLSRPELRAVLRTVLEQLGGSGEVEDDDDGRPTSLELLKPFKMAHASPRVFWNLAKEFDGDVARGLRELLPQQDWAFLDERDKKRSGKAVANARQAAQEAAAKTERAAKAEAKKAAMLAAREAAVVAAARGRTAAAESADVEADGSGATEAEAEEAAGIAEAEDDELEPKPAENEDEEEEEEEEEEAEPEPEPEPEPAPDDADGWEACGKKAMLRDREYDYACVCLDRALQIRIDACGGREAADEDVTMAHAWYLHGSALLRRAQALAHTLATSEEAAVAAAGAAGSSSASSSGAGGSSAADPSAAAAATAAKARLSAEWETVGSAAIGRRARRFFALHGMAEGTVIAWQPPVEAAGAAAEEAEEAEGAEEALYRIAMDDGDVEDLDELELDEALAAQREDRTVGGEVEELLEAAWEALEMAAGLYTRPLDEAGPVAAATARSIGAAEAHERLGDCALQNDQPERALEEYTQARSLLGALQQSGSLPTEDRRLADIEWYLGVTQLQLGKPALAMGHYRQAAATLRLRSAILERRSQDRKIARLSSAAAGGSSASNGAAGDDEAADAEDQREVEQIAELLGEIDARVQEVSVASSAEQV